MLQPLTISSLLRTYPGVRKGAEGLGYIQGNTRSAKTFMKCSQIARVFFRFEFQSANPCRDEPVHPHSFDTLAFCELSGTYVDSSPCRGFAYRDYHASQNSRPPAPQCNFFLDYSPGIRRPGNAEVPNARGWTASSRRGFAD